MKNNHLWKIILVGLFVLFIVLFPPQMFTSAQEGVFIETFDDPDLPGWEHTPGVIVAEGNLHLEMGNSVTHDGDWTNLHLTTRLRLDGDGEFVIIYKISDSGGSILVLGQNFIISQHESDGKVTELASNSPIGIPWGEWFQLDIFEIGGEHRFLINGEEVLLSIDLNPLPSGGVGFEVLGGAFADIDELIINAEEGGEEAVQTEDAPPSDETEDTQQSGTTISSEPLPLSSLKWIFTGGPPGGLGYDIRYNFENPEIWYVTDSFAGLFRSTDGGLTWKSSSEGILPKFGPTGDLIPVFCVTIDHLNPNIAWAGTQNTGHIYKSTDSGQTWVLKDNGVPRTYEGLHFRGFTVDPHSSDIVYAMAETSVGDTIGGQVFKTTNSGESWKLIWDGGMPSALTRYLWVNPKDTDILYVSTGIFDREAVGPEPYSDLTSGLGILKSTDGGETWRELNTNNGLELLHIGSLYMHPENPDILLAAAGHVMNGEDIMTLETQGIRPSGIYRTKDGGENWEKVLAPDDFHIAETYSSVEFCTSDPNIAYAASIEGVYRSDDAGINWQPVTTVFGWGPPGVLAGFPIDIQCDPSNPDRLFINNYGGGNFLSEDGGKSWENASQGYTGAVIISLAVDPKSSGRVFATGVQSGFWGTHDGGNTWVGLRPENVGFYENGPGAIAVDPSNSDHLISGGRPGFVIIESFDSGDNWQQLWSMHEKGIETDLSEYAIPTSIVFAPSNPQTIYLGGHLRNPIEPYTQGIGVFISKDNGKTWNQTKDSTMQKLSPFHIAVNPIDEKIVYAGTGDGVYKSTDGGDTWNLLHIPPENGRVFTVAVNPSNPDYIIAGVEKSGPYISQDGGKTWQAGIAGWEPNGTPTGIVFDSNQPNIVYLGDIFSGMYRSEDGGYSWQKTNKGLNIRAILGLVISGDGGHLYASTDGGGVFRLDLYGFAPQPSTPLVSTAAEYTGEGALTDDPSQNVEEPITDGPPPEEDLVGQKEKFKIPCPGNALPLFIVGLAWFDKQRRK